MPIPTDIGFVPPHPAGTVVLFEARGHVVRLRRDRTGSLRYTLDHERERNALELSNRFARLYERS